MSLGCYICPIFKVHLQECFAKSGAIEFLLAKMDCNDDFSNKNIKYLQEYLKERGVVTGNKRKADLKELCNTAKKIYLEIDPDGTKDDKAKALESKLLTSVGIKLKLPFLCIPSNDLSVLPKLSIFDLYNHLANFDNFDMASMRDFEKMEGHQMFREKYVKEINPGSFENTHLYSFVIVYCLHSIVHGVFCRPLSTEDIFLLL